MNILIDKLKVLVEKRVKTIAEIAMQFSGGKLDLSPRQGELLFKCDIYTFEGEYVIIPIGTKSLPVGISKTDADISIFTNIETKESISIFNDELKEIIRENASRETLSFNEKIEAIVITLKIKTINYGKRYKKE